jgi:hypothetical protein
MKFHQQIYTERIGNLQEGAYSGVNFRSLNHSNIRFVKTGFGGKRHLGQLLFAAQTADLLPKLLYKSLFFAHLFTVKPTGTKSDRIYSVVYIPARIIRPDQRQVEDHCR